MNLVSIIMQMLTPELLGKLASGIGGDKSLVQRAASAAIPAILGSLAGVAGQPGGGSLITNAISKLDPGMMGNLGSVLGGAGQGALATTGSNILGSLLGNSALGTLAGAIGKFSGLGNSASTGLLGALVPMILGSIGQQQKSMGLDAGGVAKLLQDQTSNIQASMPGDFAKLLSGTGLMGNMMGQATNMASSATNMASSAAGAAAGMASKAAGTMSSAAGSATSMAASTAGKMADDAAAATSGGMGWLPWIVGLVAIGAILWWLMHGTAPQTPAMAPTPVASTMAMPAMPSIKVGDTDVGAMMHDAMGKLTTALPTIKDADSANKAMGDLTSAGDMIGKVAGMADKIPADGKPLMAAAVKAGMGMIAPMVTAAEANPTAGPIVKPVLDGIMGKLDAMTK